MLRNHLAEETSPYLLQHADNPVDWYPWGDAALLRGQAENKPILLSIGYSACHWCHVMAHESFEDPATAALMNELFINIKVDREERPDLDKIYQVAQQMLTHGSGGWPLTMFLTPQEQPFFGGTYFPKEPRHGHACVPRSAAPRGRLLPRTGRGDRRAERAASSGARLHGAAAASGRRAGHIAAWRRHAQRSSDPSTHNSAASPARRNFRTRAASNAACGSGMPLAEGRTPILQALYMASLTLTRMAEGGIYDQLGGGFARYSVDGAWMIPHFEKMLYDNGQLLCEYARAHLATGEALFARVAQKPPTGCCATCAPPQGGFYSSLDADSEGHEGKFYVWTRAEVQTLLNPQEYAAFSPASA